MERQYYGINEIRKTTILTPLIKLYAAVVNILSIVSLRIPANVRNIVFNASVFLIVMISLWRWFNSDIHDMIEWDTIIICYIVLFILLLFSSIDRRVVAADIHWNFVFWVGWFICFLFMFISACLYDVNKDYFIWSTLALTCFPMLFLVWQSRDDYDTLFKTIAWAIVISSFVFFILSVPAAMIFDHSEFTADYFLGIAGNPNGNGMVATGFFAAGIYLALDSEKTNICALIAMAIAISLSIESNCRTAELAIVLCAFVGWIFYARTSGRGFVYVIKKTMSSLLLVLVFTVLFCIILRTVNATELFVYAITNAADISPETYNTLNALSSGRLGMWCFYTRDINMLGHGIMDVTGLPKQYHWAHNNLIDVLYISGAIAAFGYFIWLLYTIAFVVKCAFFRAMKRPEYLFVIVSVIGYFCEAMLEVTIYPMSTGIVFMAFMGFALVSGTRCAYDTSNSAMCSTK